ncbi:MAG: histidine kinase dimerization/phospho-acceptor domain-containing protein, partial [Desulfurivibrionaceae bacterium]|nr:histidine kinase dimerization/phospho-acceptor domain-containing protein [Desulfurivibrionaceae bacterium]
DGQLSDDLALALVQEALASGSRRAPWLYQREDGSTFAAEMLLTPIPVGGRRLLHVVVRDVTAQRTAEEEQRRLQALLQQTQKLEAIGTLAGGIAHDFNNALGPIMGYTEMAMDELDEGSLVRRNLGHVLVCAERARDLVQQILAFSRDGGTKVAPLNAAPVVAETVQLLRASLPTTVEIRTRVEMGDAWVNANPSHIH